MFLIAFGYTTNSSLQHANFKITKSIIKNSVCV